VGLEYKNAELDLGLHHTGFLILFGSRFLKGLRLEALSALIEVQRI